MVITLLIYKQPENTSITTFKLPFSPFLQMTAVFVNVFLITTLSIDTYIRFGIWFGLGLIIYISYGIRKSGEHRESLNQCWWCLPCIERSPFKNEEGQERIDNKIGHENDDGINEESQTNYGADLTSIN